MEDRVTALIQQRLNEKEVPPECPACGSLEGRFRKFRMLKAASDDWEPLVGRDQTLRVLSVTCGNCGHMRLFDADELGL